MTDQTPDTLRALDLEELIRLLRCVRPRDCGVHYCRYCPAESPKWEHSPSCPYVESQRECEDARAMIAALIALADQSPRPAEDGPLPNAPDDADARTVLRYVRMCAASWESGARLLGNARAGDIVRACDTYLAAPAPTGAPHACDEGWICEAHPDKPWPHDACLGPGMPCPCGRAFRTSDAQARAERRQFRMVASTPDPATPAPTGAPTAEENPR